MPSLPYPRRIVDRFERLTALMSVSQNLETERKQTEIRMRRQTSQQLSFVHCFFLSFFFAFDDLFVGLEYNRKFRIKQQHTNNTI